jgi:hypothetical protein
MGVFEWSSTVAAIVSPYRTALAARVLSRAGKQSGARFSALRAANRGQQPPSPFRPAVSIFSKACSGRGRRHRKSHISLWFELTARWRALLVERPIGEAQTAKALGRIVVKATVPNPTAACDISPGGYFCRSYPVVILYPVSQPRGERWPYNIRYRPALCWLWR